MLASNYQSSSTAIWGEVAQNGAAKIAKSPTLRALEYSLHTLDAGQLQSQLQGAPQESELGLGNEQHLISFPTPDGALAQFNVFVSPIMEPEFAAKYPEIQTFAGKGISDPAATIRFDMTPAGFHAQILSPNGAYYVDPYYHLGGDLYASYFATSILADADFHELDIDDSANKPSEKSKALPDVGFGANGSSAKDGPGTPLSRSGTQLRTYRTAVAATGEYTAFHGGTVALGQAAIVTAINRVSGIYESELSIRLQLVANNDLLVYTNSTTDPYTSGNVDAMLTQNQTNVDAVIGNANYDLGHVFSTGGEGKAGLGSVGINNIKARGVTGLPSPVGDAFWVDFVAHEMGHQFGGNHTFNGSAGNCVGGNRNASTAYEPGSGSTIQAYAGICGSDNLQPNSDPYFHSVSFDEIIIHVDNVIPSVGVRTATGNSVPTVNAGADFTIPANTPFVVTASGSDANSTDVLTYNWEQRNLGPAQGVLVPDNGLSPLFRSWLPTTVPSRTFPRLTNLVNNNFEIGEKMPLTTRTLNFRATIRDNALGGGGVNTDDMIVNVINTGSAFAVTSPNTNVSWEGLSTQTVTWDVAGTTANGINAANVDIRLSIDGGLTYPTMLAAGVPNDGSQDILAPNLSTSSARIRVQGSGHIFFDISNVNFSIIAATTGIDFGDAPDIPYGTLLVSNGARHNVGGPVLGTLIDVELDGQPNSTATGDGNDEDGVRFIHPLVAGTTVDIEVRSSIGGGMLNYFFDFDGVGGFGNLPNEFFSATLTGGTQVIPVTIPSTTVLATFARFRISTLGGLGPLGEAATGEVEDYAVTLFATAPALDFGDAPDPSYATLLASNGPRHIVTGPRLGALVDSELNGQPNATSTGDGPDDDGVIFRAPLIPGSTVQVSVTSTGGVLDYFFDFDANGVLGNQPNEIFSATIASGTQTVPVVVPPTAVLGVSRARFRISTAGGLAATGLAQDGEVEDYQVMFATPPVLVSDYENFDTTGVPSLPTDWTATTTSSNSWVTVGTGSHTAPNHAFVNSIVTISDSRLISPIIPITATSRQLRFRNSYNTEPGFDGGVLEVSIAGGAFQDILAAGGTFLQGGYSGALSTGFGSPLGGRQTWNGNSSGFIETIVDLPAAAVGQNVQIRWRYATDDGISVGGWRIDTIRLAGNAFSFDFGDAPDPTFPTLIANNGAAHAQNGTLMLGAAIDTESNGQPTADASGDGADEDGVTFPATLIAGVSNSITVTASAVGILNAWVDFNNNGNWNDPGEQIFKDIALVSGPNNLSFPVPSASSTFSPFARFRLSSQSALAPDGSAPDGEVEDYQVTIVPADATPPTVNSVKVSSTTWTADFKSYVDPVSKLGYPVPTGSAAQLDSLPWINVDRLLVSFSEDVGASLSASDFSIVGQPGFRANGTQPSVPTITSMNLINLQTAELVLSQSIEPMWIDLKITSAGVMDTSGNILDGNWTNGGTNTQSGNGSIVDPAAQNDFSFRMALLPADSGPVQNKVVNSTDIALIISKQNEFINLGGGSATPGYNPKADLNGSQVVNSTDVAQGLLRQNSFLLPPVGLLLGEGEAASRKLIETKQIALQEIIREEESDLSFVAVSIVQAQANSLDSGDPIESESEYQLSVDDLMAEMGDDLGNALVPMFGGSLGQRFDK